MIRLLVARVSRYLPNYGWPFYVLVASLFTISLAGLILSTSALIATGFEDNVFSYDFCISNSCILVASGLFSQSLNVLKGTVALLAAIATVGGIIVALLGYLNSVTVSALGNHISHISVFQSYLSAEISKRDLISPASVDVYFWYRAIFTKSRLGQTSVSEEYISYVEDVAFEIERSNTQAINAHAGSFRYSLHQDRLIKSLSNIGIKIGRHPRTDFFQIEKQIFSLIGSVNAAFCYDGEAGELPPVRYY